MNLYTWISKLRWMTGTHNIYYYILWLIPSICIFLIVLWSWTAKFVRSIFLPKILLIRNSHSWPLSLTKGCSFLNIVQILEEEALVGSKITVLLKEEIWWKTRRHFLVKLLYHDQIMLLLCRVLILLEKCLRMFCREKSPSCSWPCKMLTVFRRCNQLCRTSFWTLTGTFTCSKLMLKRYIPWWLIKICVLGFLLNCKIGWHGNIKNSMET